MHFLLQIAVCLIVFTKTVTVYLRTKLNPLVNTLHGGNVELLITEAGSTYSLHGIL
jgi:hypothetical protein